MVLYKNSKSSDGMSFLVHQQSKVQWFQKYVTFGCDSTKEYSHTSNTKSILGTCSILVCKKAHLYSHEYRFTDNLKVIFNNMKHAGMISQKNFLTHPIPTSHLVRVSSRCLRKSICILTRILLYRHVYTGHQAPKHAPLIVNSKNTYQIYVDEACSIQQIDRNGIISAVCERCQAQNSKLEG